MDPRRTSRPSGRCRCSSTSPTDAKDAYPHPAPAGRRRRRRGVPFNTICPDARKSRCPDRGADRQPPSPDCSCSASRVAGALSRCVYLAECTPDMDDPEKPINRGRMKAFLEELGWTVLPSVEYPVERLSSLLDDRSEGSVSPSCSCSDRTPGSGAGSTASRTRRRRASDPRFRFRSSEIDLAKVDAAQREFLIGAEVMATGFEDFKSHVEKELRYWRSAARRSAEEEGGETPPLGPRRHPFGGSRNPCGSRYSSGSTKRRKSIPYQLKPGETIETSIAASRAMAS